MKEGIRQGVCACLSAWLIYGLIEFTLAVAIPQLWLRPDVRLLKWQMPLLGALFGAYAGAGLLSGILGGVLLGLRRAGSPDRTYASWAGLILTLAFAVNLISAWPLARSEEIALAIAAALIVTFCCALISDDWNKRVAFLANPWTICLLLLAAPWVSRDAIPNSASWIKTAVSAAALTGVAGFSAMSRRLPNKLGLAAGKAVAAIGLVAALWAGISKAEAGASDPPESSGSHPQPNILLITMDTVRADHTSLYGYERETTPHLKEFAREATVYDRAIASEAFTLPSHASMFTGLYPSWHGATVRPEHPWGPGLTSDVPTLAGILKGAGYWTAETAANYGYLGKASGLTEGFAVSDVSLATRLSDPDRPAYLREGARKLLGLFMDTSGFGAHTLRAEDINRRAFALLDEAGKQRRPFFLFLNYMDAHLPYLPPEPFRSQFSKGVTGRSSISPEALLTEIHEINLGREHLSEDERGRLISQYDGGIAYMDFEISRLLDRLKEAGLYDNTLVLIAADHGEAFGDHNFVEHAVGSVYQDQIHVPLIIKYPGQHMGRRSDVLVSQVDFMPTILAEAGITPAAGLQGRNLEVPPGIESVVFSEGRARGDLVANPELRGVRRAIFSGSLKLITWTMGEPELYDLLADPAELKNLYRAGDPQAAALMARLSAWTASIPRQLSKPAAPDKSTLERLKSLGYAQ